MAFGNLFQSFTAGFVLASVFMSGTGAVAAGTLDTLDEHLAAFSEKAKVVFAEGETKVVAAIPFADDLGGVRRIGWMAAEMVQTQIAALPGVKVAERSRLEDIMREKEAWLADFFEARDPARRAEAAKILKADFLVLGTLVPAGNEVRFNVRLVESASGVVKAASSFSIPRTADIEDLFWYVQPPKKRPERPFEVPPIELSYAVFAQKKMPDGSAREFTVKDGSVLRSGDQFQVQFTPVSDCWVYIFLFGSTGKCETLFPYPGVKLGNFCRGGVSYTVPDPDAASGSRWFYLDNNPGTETLYIVASYGPMNDIAKVLAEMQNGEAGQAALSDRLREQVDEVRKKAAEPPRNGEAVMVRKIPASVEAPYGKAGEVLRGRFSCVKKIRLVHK
ncbi:MAG TPA: FlgO family outer membrane protein [Phycisphaerae bacterium]|nr:FlgO family outer membrane protein [Phycisphaerae bacterium]